MTNDKSNMNELVTDDDDPTAELEALTLESASAKQTADDLSESAADTFDYVNSQDRSADDSITELKSDLKSRSETIDRLQYDIEQLRARWTGLEREIKAREALTTKLNVELESSAEKLARKEKLIKKRDQAIRSLKAEIRSRNDIHSELGAALIAHEQRIEQLQKQLAADRTDEAEQNYQILQQQAGRIAGAEVELRDLHAQLQRTESYADSIRQQLHDRTRVTNEADEAREFLQASLRTTIEQVADLKSELSEAQQINANLIGQIAELKAAHAEDVRMIRFELGEAQETVAQHELVAEQLASDLVDTRSFKDELEHMLSESKANSQSRIEQLEKENRRLAREAAEIKDKLQTKSEAINCLLAELAKKSQQIEAIGEIGNVIHEIDNRISERIDDRSSKDRDRVTRVLIGTVDGQELRFPLFKDRLTIGRTDQNDIHLDASYVSRRHAVIVTERDATRIIDWGSKNGVFVNSRRITEHFLQNGDTVTIGTANFRYEERPKRDA
jgi:chromosome segregation ATPase